MVQARCWTSGFSSFTSVSKRHCGACSVAISAIKAGSIESALIGRLVLCAIDFAETAGPRTELKGIFRLNECAHHHCQEG